jgi:hypothetical protein
MVRLRGWTRLSGYPTFLTLAQNYPLWFIKTDGSVILDHNRVLNPRVRLILTVVLDDVIIKKSTDGTSVGASALNVSVDLSYTPGVPKNRMSRLQALTAAKGAVSDEASSLGIDCSRVE